MLTAFRTSHSEGYRRTARRTSDGPHRPLVDVINPPRNSLAFSVKPWDGCRDIGSPVR
jgi:hypothetical protein